MDVGNKTLSQLSDEAKEKRYVSLPTAAKISGYTTDYLDRLCRLNKIECRTWNQGEFVIELASLLAETHAILLSYEDIHFVEKSLLVPETAPIAPAASSLVIDQSQELKAGGETEAGRVSSEKRGVGMTQSVPSFREANHVPLQGESGSTFSVIGNVVVSNTAEDEKKKESEMAALLNKAAKSEEPRNTGASTPRSVDVPSAPVHTMTHVPVNGVLKKIADGSLRDPSGAPVASSRDPQPSTSDVLSSLPVVHLEVRREHATPVPVQAKNDEWDTMLLGGHTDAPVSAPTVSVETEVPAETTAPRSPYHPIQTSVDASVHHEDLPLFPVLSALGAASSASPVIDTSHSAIPDLGNDKRVVVFLPGKYPYMTVPQKVVAVSPERSSPKPALPVPQAPRTRPSVFPAPSAPLSVVSSVRTVPSIRVMAHDLSKVAVTLPVTGGEHHLILREKYPLLKSVGFNVAFALFLIGAGMLSFGGSMGNTPVGSNSVSYVAGVGAATGPLRTTHTAEEVIAVSSDQNTVLPFSDEITVATGADTDSIVVQPIFKGSAGSAHEYSLPQ